MVQTTRLQQYDAKYPRAIVSTSLHAHRRGCMLCGHTRGSKTARSCSCRRCCRRCRHRPKQLAARAAARQARRTATQSVAMLARATSRQRRLRQQGAEGQRQALLHPRGWRNCGLCALQSHVKAVASRPVWRMSCLRTCHCCQACCVDSVRLPWCWCLSWRPNRGSSEQSSRCMCPSSGDLGKQSQYVFRLFCADLQT